MLGANAGMHFACRHELARKFHRGLRCLRSSRAGLILYVVLSATHRVEIYAIVLEVECGRAPPSAMYLSRGTGPSAHGGTDLTMPQRGIGHQNRRLQNPSLARWKGR